MTHGTAGLLFHERLNTMASSVPRETKTVTEGVVGVVRRKCVRQFLEGGASATPALPALQSCFYKQNNIRPKESSVDTSGRLMVS